MTVEAAWRELVQQMLVLMLGTFRLMEGLIFLIVAACEDVDLEVD